MDELDELRLAVAKAKGYTFWDSLDKLGPWPRKNNPREAFYAGGIPLYKVDDPDPAKITWYDNDPDWPRDKAAAFELLDEMGPGATLHRDDNGHWSCWIGNKMFTASHDCETAPEAISRCWLAWKEGAK